jgi:hypothetical protein
MGAILTLQFDSICKWCHGTQVSRETVHRGTDDPEEIRMLKEAQAGLDQKAISSF